MCQSKNTDSCSGDCNNCTAPTLHAADIHKRFEKLSHTTEAEPAVKETPSHCSDTYIE